MHVRVDQARQQRGIAQIDDFRALKTVNRCADRLDALALNQNLARPQDIAAFNFEEPGGMENDGARGWLLCQALKGNAAGQEGAGAEQSESIAMRRNCVKQSRHD
jgi:hypothetical protein